MQGRGSNGFSTGLTYMEARAELGRPPPTAEPVTFSLRFPSFAGVAADRASRLAVRALQRC